LPTGASPGAAPQASPDGDLLDAEVLDGLLGLGDGAFLDRVLDLYRAQGPVALATLRSALAVSDQPAIARAAHSLKSMSANIGARALVARLRAIEDAARNAACAEPQEACDGLETLLAVTIRDLEGRTRAQAVAA
jgi:HPt (histidine-containing phosphotransfer) domain-containing protein